MKSPYRAIHRSMKLKSRLLWVDSPGRRYGLRSGRIQKIPSRLQANCGHSGPALPSRPTGGGGGGGRGGGVGEGGGGAAHLSARRAPTRDNRLEENVATPGQDPHRLVDPIDDPVV